MARILLIATVLFGIITSVSPAAMIIDVGNHVVHANSTGQEVPIWLYSDSPFSAVNLFAQIDTGGPVIEDIILFDDAGPEDYLFDNNHVGVTDFDGPNTTITSDLFPYFEGRFTSTVSGDITTSSGQLATIVLDTTGFNAGQWNLTLANTDNGSSNLPPFLADEITINDGTVSIGIPVPEPSSFIAFLMMASFGFIMFKRKR